ncbi:MAG: tetratricopeptide repeat protein [Bacteroidota bacterium]|nr:tetratricopeptide repeat protein [Bacteroidota bacterium]
MRRINYTFLLILFFTAAAVSLLEYCSPKTKNETTTLAGNTYVGDQQCKSCHAQQYNDWLRSDHFKSIQTATDSSVLGNFNNASFDADGVHSTFFKKNGKYFINTQGEDGKNHDYQVLYTFGHFPLQQYLIAFPGGRMQATRASWDCKQHKWFHQYAGTKIDSHDWLHWTGNAQNWNTMCAECHSTNLQKNYNIEKDSYDTHFSVLNVSCEACHGPGKKHIDYINGEDYKKGNKIAHSLLQLPKGVDQLSQINTCAPCHAVQSDIDANAISSDELLYNHIPVIPNTERFYADGQVKEEDYNYASFLQSKMFRRGIKCSNCHNPHSGKIYFTGNQTCLQCHAKTFDSPQHHFHATNTEGALCINCHAPGKYYMGNDLRHDHSFRIPRPDLSVQYATPNACNNCHKDKSAQWAAAAVVKWYGPKRKYHFAEDLIPGSFGDEKSEPHLLRLMSDTAVPSIIKATAANYLGNIHSTTSLQTLLNCLKNPNAQVRYEALRSLASFSSLANKTAIADALNDKVRAVRIAAAQTLNILGANDLPEQYTGAYQSAKAELERFLLYQADYAHGNINLGDYYQRNNNFSEAERFYKRAIQKDSLANLARLNLSVTLNSEGKNKEALLVLETAVKTDNKNDQAWMNLGLLYAELKDIPKALAAFAKSDALHSQNTRLYYNYGLLLQQNGKTQQAINVLQKGLQLNNTDESLNYAMAYVFMQNNQPAKAMQYARVLKNSNPNNPDYQQLFQALGL